MILGLLILLAFGGAIGVFLWVAHLDKKDRKQWEEEQEKKKLEFLEAQSKIPKSVIRVNTVRDESFLTDVFDYTWHSYGGWTSKQKADMEIHSIFYTKRFTTKTGIHIPVSQIRSIQVTEEVKS